MKEEKTSSKTPHVVVKSYAEFTLPKLGHVLQVDVNLCDGCNSCMVACKQEYDLPVGVNRIKIIKIGPREVRGKEGTYGLAMDFVPIVCQHCETPPCVLSCPADAIKRSDGIVLIDEETCIGCKACITSCPFGVIGFNYEKGFADKCSMCVHLLREAKEPACTRACPTGALKLVSIDEIGKDKKIRTALALSSVAELKGLARMVKNLP